MIRYVGFADIIRQAAQRTGGSRCPPPPRPPPPTCNNPRYTIDRLNRHGFKYSLFHCKISFKSLFRAGLGLKLGIWLPHSSIFSGIPSCVTTSLTGPDKPSRVLSLSAGAEHEPVLARNVIRRWDQANHETGFDLAASGRCAGTHLQNNPQLLRDVQRERGRHCSLREELPCGCLGLIT